MTENKSCYCSSKIKKYNSLTKLKQSVQKKKSFSTLKKSQKKANSQNNLDTNKKLCEDFGTIRKLSAHKLKGISCYLKFL